MRFIWLARAFGLANRNKPSSVALILSWHLTSWHLSARFGKLCCTPSLRSEKLRLHHRFFSPQGRCYSHDERAAGYGRGEGAAALLIKPLRDALRDSDPIRAVIRNTAANQDGWTQGITLPSKDAQIALIRSAYNDAGLDFSKTAYCEAHGTGTAVGDPM